MNNRFQQLMNDAYRTILDSSYEEESIDKPEPFEEVRRWIMLGAISWYQNEDITPTDKTLEDFLRDVGKALDIDRHEQNSSNEMFPNIESPFATGSKGWSFELTQGSRPKLIIPQWQDYYATKYD